MSTKNGAFFTLRFSFFFGVIIILDAFLSCSAYIYVGKEIDKKRQKNLPSMKEIFKNLLQMQISGGIMKVL